MLGLSDRGEIIALFERVMKGEIAEALDLVRALHQAGADAADILIELAEFCHFVTRAKIAPAATDDPAVSEIERERGREFAGKLTLGVLTRAWQILLKGVEDVRDSPRPLASAEMALIRLAYASDLPAPEEALRKLSQSTDGPRHAPPLPPGRRRSARVDAARRGGARSSPRPRRRLRRPRRRPRLASLRGRRRAGARQARHSARPVARAGRAARALRTGQHRLHPGRRRRVRARADARADACRNGPASAGWWRWSRARPRRRLREAAEAREAERASGAAAHPLVRKVLDRFKGARIVDVRRPEAAAGPAGAAKPTTRSATPIPASTPPTTSEKEIAPWISWA